LSKRLKQLTTLPMGGGKGGADFDQKENQIMK
jgi:glutamate dehydrogenase/leucine dehydrogenase